MLRFSEKEMKSLISALLFCTILPCFLFAQNLPSEVSISPDGTLRYGGNPTEGLYNTQEVHKLEITLQEPNWFQLLQSNGSGPSATPGETLIGTLTFNDTLVLDSVLVSIKGQTSDFQNNSEKKSFKIEIDEIIDQDLLGYDNLNLNCGFQDRASMREVLYNDVSRPFTPALKGAFVDLYINGQSWGPYNSIQQIEGTYIKEWFTNNDGTRWRAVRPDDVPSGGPGSPGGIFGTGYSTLNYNGPDSTDYNEYYTLKKTEKDNPWEDLIEVCDDLNNLPVSALYDELKYTLDIDRTLWLLAREIIFSDDDSYVHKGGMDYYVYWDEATDRIIPMEVDGNSVLRNNHVDWSPFYHEEDADFPLLHRLLQNNEIRQRYLAHVRTILELHFTEDQVHARIDEFAAMLDERVQNDPKKIYSYNQFLNGVQSLKNTVSNRIGILSAHDEVDRTGVLISAVQMETSAGVDMAPLSDEEVQVTVNVEGDEQAVWLYYGSGFDGVFERFELFDDGMHGDQEANDNIYGGFIPGHSAGTYVRYYIEAIKDDNFSTAVYYPRGAEHDAFLYQVGQVNVSPEDVVINEFMAKNENTVTDNAGEYDDWIELYNKGTETVDLSGYFLSDGDGEIAKWAFPDGTSIAPDGYLIVWADKDDDQASADELHANFKLSADGEQIYLANPDTVVIDTVFYTEQEEDASYARLPNGTGDFEIANPTFNGYNGDGSTNVLPLSESNTVQIYPNPVQHGFSIHFDKDLNRNRDIILVNSLGQLVLKQKVNSGTELDVSGLAAGIYSVIVHDYIEKQSYSDKILIVR